MDSEVKDIRLPDQVTIVDHDLPQAPNVSANALARYEFPLGAGTASMQADVIYSDDFCFTTLCAPVEKEKGYTVANARIGYGAPDGRWEVAACGEQPVRGGVPRVRLRQLAVRRASSLASYGKPRWYGVTATFRFGAGYN